MSGRTLLLVGVAATALGAACNDDDAGEAVPVSTTQADIGAVESTWDGRLEVDFETGAVRAPGFNDLIDDAHPSWANSAREAAEVLVNTEDGDGQIEIRGEDDVTVVATITGLPDDSVEAVRYELNFRRGEDGRLRFVDGSWSQRCQPGRGHDDRILPETCV